MLRDSYSFRPLAGATTAAQSSTALRPVRVQRRLFDDRDAWLAHPRNDLPTGRTVMTDDTHTDTINAAASSNDELAQFVADIAALSIQLRNPALADRLGSSLVQHVQAISAAVRQRFVAPPAR